MNPVSITDTTDWICKCGHKHHEHWLMSDGCERCMHGFTDDIHEDSCDCLNFSSQENKA